jgi:hypothetical protein
MRWAALCVAGVPQESAADDFAKARRQLVIAGSE